MNAKEDLILDLDTARNLAALQTWVEDCKNRMRTRWPVIEFESKIWPINSQYNTKLRDINFGPALRDFNGRDPAYVIALKCLMAEIAMKGDVKHAVQMQGWRLLSRLNMPLLEIRREHLKGLEAELVEQAQASPISAARIYNELLILTVHLNVAAAKGVTERLTWSVAPQTKTRLNALQKSSGAEFRASKASILDRQIEALSDAQTAMFRGDERLSAYDRVSLAVMGLSMCCPSRVNEPLCMAVDDRFTLEDYLTAETDSARGTDDPTLARVHQMLLVKGSKGAAWGGKPILNFMIAFADLCIEVIEKHGERSRMLVTWYENHPNTLFLPPQLEHLRGCYISRQTLWQIMQLQSSPPENGVVSLVNPVWQELHAKRMIKMTANPKAETCSDKDYYRKVVQGVAWSDLEPVLLSRVKQAMEGIRRVTQINHYQGRLSKMLMLFDTGYCPYLPNSIKYQSLKKRLLQNAGEKRPTGKKSIDWAPEPTLFAKLDIKMMVNGVVETAYIGTHDPRRWLTTQALDSGLPDVLANKWANRLSITQLKHYDIRSPERKAQRAAMPDIKELEDMTQGLQRLGALEDDYGLKTEVVVVGDANIAITSMREIMQATENRPVARTSNQIIILYPQKYGVCLHQHHERPCRSYKCAPCNEGVVVKGHLPTNERVRKDADLVFRSIVNQLEALLIARQRQLADNPDTLDEHLLTLVREGLNSEEMAKELIARFHEINDLIRDRSFANQLAEAFALTGYVEQLKRESNQSGALIKYHNPSHHAAPGHERAIEAIYGGRASVKAKIRAFDRKHPQFSQTALGKQDQRELLESDDDDEQEAVNG